MTPRDLIEQNHFRRAHDGGLVFFPWSLRGQGYLVLDEPRKSSIERVLKALYVSLLLLALAAYTALHFGLRPWHLDAQGWACVIAIGLAPLLLYRVWLGHAIYQLPPSDFRVSESELRERAAGQLVVWKLRVALLGSWFFAATSAAIAWLSPEHFWLGVAGLLVFTLTGIAMAYLLQLKREVDASAERA